VLHIWRHCHQVSVPLLHQPGVHEGAVLDVHVGEEPPLPIPLLHVELQADGLPCYELPVGFSCLSPISLNPLGGAVRLRGIDTDTVDLLLATRDAADLDGVTVYNTEHLDGDSSCGGGQQAPGQ